MSGAEPARGTAAARAALAGNPSDGYGGAVLAVTIDELTADALAESSERLVIDPPADLVSATVRRFARELEPRGVETSLRWSTSIPRGVGLGGSSAIVIAATRALCRLHEVELSPDELAAFALAVETDELGISAGLQDRIAQSYGGLVFMDFARSRNEPLPRELLPPLVIAWRGDAAADSGPLHSDLRARHERGEPLVGETMTTLAAAARAAREALRRRDRRALATSIDATFDARRRLLSLNPRHVEMVEVARACGVAANYTGSGGAIVAACDDERNQDRVAVALSEIGCGVLAMPGGQEGQDSRRIPAG